MKLVLIFSIFITTIYGNLEFEWMNSMLPPKERAELLLLKMNLTEKVHMLHGSPGPYV